MWKKVINFFGTQKKHGKKYHSTVKVSNSELPAENYATDSSRGEKVNETESSLDFDIYKDIDYRDVTCPYCDFEYEKKPKRKRKCPSCENPVYRLTHAETKENILVTEKDMNRINDRRSKKGFIKNWAKRLDGLGYPKNKFYKFRERLKRGDQKPLENDIIWSAFGKLLNQEIESGAGHHELKMIHYEMALFLQAEGKDFNFELRESNKHSLLKFKNSIGLDGKVKISGTINQCIDCLNEENLVYSVREALSEMPLPCGGKTQSGDKCFCMCRYVAHFDK